MRIFTRVDYRHFQNGIFQTIVHEAVLCLYKKQDNTWALGDMELSSRVQIDVSLVRCAHSNTRR